MRRYQSLGLGVVSALFLASMIGACSASGNDPTVPGGSGAADDSGAAADTSYTYEAGSVTPTDSGTGVKTPIDSGPVVPFDAGPMNDCDLSGAGAITYFMALQSGGDGACNATDDSCSTAGDCCVNLASLSGGLPPEFASLLGASPTCVPK